MPKALRQALARVSLTRVLRPVIRRVLTPVGQFLARTPVTPNEITIAGTVGMSAGDRKSVV